MSEILISPSAAKRLAWNELLPLLRLEPELYLSTKPPFSKVKNPEPGSFPKPLPDEICYKELVAATQLNLNLWKKNKPPSLREKFIAEFLKSGLAVLAMPRKKVRLVVIDNKYIQKGRSLDVIPDLTTDEAKEAMRRGAEQVLEMAAREPRRSKAPARLSSERFEAYLSRLDMLIVTPVPLVDNRLTPEHAMEHIDRVLAEEFSTEVG
ncbi:hypothetical protein ASE61_04855 [Bosea sp. Root670]|uniref:hypothetical protein n=1 Tax=Bosea sp. Root670 TaxID=1736583 RepID=UPI000713EFDB|nr:hypothetical protein [Bosea sp. Root670]KRE08880.1 hypothetical protein ASE61_04855 [Bosea sp. Root670]